MDRGAWQATVHGVAEELDITEQLTHTQTYIHTCKHTHTHTHTYTHTHTHTHTLGLPLCVEEHDCSTNDLFFIQATACGLE